MQFDEMAFKDGKVLFLLPGTACDYQTNFGAVLDRLAAKYRLVCVNYDGFDGSGSVFPDMLTVTEKIERYMPNAELKIRPRLRSLWLYGRRDGEVCPGD